MACRNCGHGVTSHLVNVGGEWMDCPCTRYVNDNETNSCGCENFEDGIYEKK